MSKTALILVDIQNDYFPGGKWEVHNIQTATRNAARLLEDARQKGNIVVHVRHEIPMEGAPFFEPGTTGAEIHETVAPQDDELIVLKHKVNSFQDTDLGEYLRSHEVTAVTVCGAMSQMCIDAITRAASDFGYETTVVEDACGAKEQTFGGVDVPAEHVHATIMSALGFAYAKVVTTDEYLAG